MITVFITNRSRGLSSVDYTRLIQHTWNLLIGEHSSISESTKICYSGHIRTCKRLSPIVEPMDGLF